MSESKYLKYSTQAHEAIPTFQSYEEEATCWDETDTGAPEIEAEMTPVRIRSTCGYTGKMMLLLDNASEQERETHTS